MKKFFFTLLSFLIFSNLNSQNISSYLAEADSLINLQKYNQAITVYKSILNQSEKKEDIYYKISECYVDLNMSDSAKFYLYKTISLDSTYSKAYATLSNIYFIDEQIDTSLSLIKLARKFKPDTAMYPIYEGITYMYYQSLDTALQLFDEALRIEPNNPTAYYYKSYVYSSVYMTDSAIKFVNLALKYKQEADYYKLKAEIYYYAERYTDALFEIDKAIELNPDEKSYQLAKIQIYAALEQYNDVLRITLPLTKQGYDADFYYYTILAFFYTNNNDSTFAYIKKARKFDANNDLFYYIEGYIHFYNRDYNNALIAFYAAIELNPEDVEYFYYACNSRILLNTDSNVFDVNEKFVELNQNNMSKMSKWANDKNHKYYYNKLQAKFIFDPTSLSLDEFFMLYFGAALQDGYSGYTNTSPAVSKAFEDEDYELCISVALDFLQSHPSSISTYYYLANSYFMLKDYTLSLKYLTVYYGFLQSVIATGYGDSKETAFIVSSVTDEYLILRYMELQFAGQALESSKKNNYDVLTYIESDNKKLMYFNIDLFFGKF